jgi:5-methylcytosine-specific restriction endonuclease McrA
MERVAERAVLVLNENYEPLHICTARRAVVLVDRGKAEVLEHDDGLSLRSSRSAYPVPSVIRLVYMIRRPRPHRKLTRKEIFARDRYTCQYCGAEARDLTIDHVTPRIRGGRHTWDNLVSACRPCNHRKGGRTPEEARMRLARPPEAPRSTPYYIVYHYINVRVEWRKFIPEGELAALA